MATHRLNLGDPPILNDQKTHLLRESRGNWGKTATGVRGGEAHLLYLRGQVVTYYRNEGKRGGGGQDIPPELNLKKSNLRQKGCFVTRRHSFKPLRKEKGPPRRVSFFTCFALARDFEVAMSKGINLVALIVLEGRYHNTKGANGFHKECGLAR